MKEMSFLSGLLVALGMSLLVKLLYPVLALLAGGAAAAQLTIAGVVICYLWILTAFSPKKSGRLVCALVIPAIECGLLLVPMQPLTFMFVSLALLWIGRISLVARGALDALVDGSLVAVAAVSMGWAVVATGSLGLLTWSFFLVLAARPLIRIPGTKLREFQLHQNAHSELDRAFYQAHSVAERALARVIR